MQITYPVVQYWKTARDPVNDRLLYEIVIGKGETIADARRELKRILGKVPRGLSVRVTFMSLDMG